MRALLLKTTATALLFIAPAFAADIPRPTTSLKDAVGGKYLLDGAHANVIFSVNHLGYSNYFGRFNKLEGTLMFDPKTPEKSGVKISIDTGSIDTNNDTLEAKLIEKKMLNIKEFPTASFTSTRLEKLSDTKGRLMGDLSLRGVTRPIVLDVTFNGAGNNPYAGPTLGFSATGSFKRSEFGIGEYVPAVSDEVRLIIEAEFNKPKDE